MSDEKQDDHGAPSRPVRETTGQDELRRNPRYPGSGVWSREERERHRAQRDAIQRDAGLDPEGRIERGSGLDPEGRIERGSGSDGDEGPARD